MNKTDKIK